MASARTSIMRPLASAVRPLGRPHALSVVANAVAGVRHKSGPYGYTQAKALVFSKPGEPSDVLR
jgi:mitochondrial enoyl-[acyl-carrier protein] reductase / trans-2-enoyl-CoA reductase